MIAGHVENRVFGPPGTGKTTFITKQLRKWASEYGSDALAALSFTRAAATELAGRDLPLKRSQVGTLHSFAYRALDGPEMTEGHTREFNDEHPAYALSLDERGSLDVDDPTVERISATEGDRLLTRMEVLRARMVPREGWPSSVRGFADAWEHWKHESGRVDFTDLIEHALRDVRWCPGTPSVGCFDEVQDFTPLELSLVRSWGAHMDVLLLAGDDDQCIYGFKGATPDAFLDPPVDDDHKRVLSQSWRVPRAVHAAAQQWIERLTRREQKHYEPRADAEGSARVMGTANYRIPELAVREAIEHAEEGRTVMLLTTCAYMLDPIKALLRREAVPFHNPYRRKRGDWNPLAPGGPRRRTASDRLLAFLRPQESAWDDDACWWRGEDLKAWIDPLRAKGLLARGAKTRADALPGVEPVDLDVFDALWDPETIADLLPHVYAGDLDWFASSLLASKAKSFDYPLRVARRHGARVLRERPRIVVGTIHSVKGGEADVVYLFPDLSMPGMREWEAGGEQRDGIVRQMYVGMTRAREHLVVCGRATPMAVEPLALVGTGAS